MKSCLATLSSILAAICAFLFVILATLAITVFVADRMAFSAGTYKQALTSQHIYDRLPALIAGQIVYQEQHSASNQGLAPELKRLTESDWQILITDLTTPDSLQAQAESLIDQFINYLNDPSATLRLQVSAVDFKQKLKGDAGYQAVTQIIDAQPPCTLQEWEAFIASNNYQFENIPICRPPAEFMVLAEPYIRQALLTLTPVVPDVIYLNEQSKEIQNNLIPSSDRLTFQRIHAWIVVSLFVAGGLLVLTLVFGVRSITGCGLWLGLPLLLVGMSTFTSALIFWRLPAYLITRAGGQLTITGVTPEITQAIVDVGISITHSAATTLGIVGIVLGVVGGGILAAGLLIGLSTRVNL